MIYKQNREDEVRHLKFGFAFFLFIAVISPLSVHAAEPVLASAKGAQQPTGVPVVQAAKAQEQAQSVVDEKNTPLPQPAAAQALTAASPYGKFLGESNITAAYLAIRIVGNDRVEYLVEVDKVGGGAIKETEVFRSRASSPQRDHVAFGAIDDGDHVGLIITNDAGFSAYRVYDCGAMLFDSARLVGWAKFSSTQFKNGVVTLTYQPLTAGGTLGDRVTKAFHI